MTNYNEALARINAVRKPWRSWQSTSLQTAMLALFLVSFFIPGSVVPKNWRRGIFLVCSMALLTINYYIREKAWRRLVEIEAPELHRKLNAPNA